MKNRSFEIYAGKVSDLDPAQTELMLKTLQGLHDRNCGYTKSHSALDVADDEQINKHMEELTQTLRRASALAGKLVYMFGGRKHALMRNTALDREQAHELSTFTRFEYRTENSKRLINEAMRFDAS